MTESEQDIRANLTALNGDAIREVTELAVKASTPERLVNGGLYAVATPTGVELLTTPGFDREQEEIEAGKPLQLVSAVYITSVGSFLSWVEGHLTPDEDFRFGEGHLELWVNQRGHRVTAVLDGLDGFGRNIADLPLRTTDEWDEWLGISGRLLGQTEFAEFVEDHLSTIAKPDGAELLDVCQTLTANTKVHFKSSQLLANGQRQFAFEETTEAKAGQKGTLKVPTTLTLGLRPIEGEEVVPVEARFRYRLNDGELKLGVKLVEPQRILDEVFQTALDAIQEEFAASLTYGERR